MRHDITIKQTIIVLSIIAMIAIPLLMTAAVANADEYQYPPPPGGGEWSDNPPGTHDPPPPPDFGFFDWFDDFFGAAWD